MQLTEESFDEIRDLFPKPRGNVRWGHRWVLNGILYVLGLPPGAACLRAMGVLEHGVRPMEVLWAECEVLEAPCSSVSVIGVW